MTEQAASGTMADAAGNTGAHGLDAQTGAPSAHEAHHGRPASWVAVSVIIVGFIGSKRHLSRGSVQTHDRQRNRRLRHFRAPRQVGGEDERGRKPDRSG